MKNIVLLVATIFAFTSCSIKQEFVEIDRYAISFDHQSLETSKNLGSIYVEDISLNRSFNQNAIFYSTKPFLFEEYKKSRWISLPSNMIQTEIVESLNKSNLFASVISRDRNIITDQILKTEITKLYHIVEDGKSYAIISANFVLIKDRKVIKNFSFDKKILCEENSAYGFVKATNFAFQEITKELLSLIPLS